MASPDTAGSAPAHPVRTCVGCRSRAAKSDLVRVVAERGALVVDGSQTRTGRGAYLHRSTQCLSQAMRRRAWARALRMRLEGGVDEQDLRRQFASTIPVAVLDERAGEA